MKLTMKEAILLAVEIYKDDLYLWNHVLGVAFTAQRAAMTRGLDENLAFCGGLLHDVGKTMYAPQHGTCLMNGTGDHPALSYEMLKDVDRDVAICALMHHMYNRDPYPEEFPAGAPSLEDVRSDEELEYICRIISVADKMEASVTRSGVSIDEAAERCYGYSNDDIDEEVVNLIAATMKSLK